MADVPPTTARRRSFRVACRSARPRVPKHRERSEAMKEPRKVWQTKYLDGPLLFDSKKSAENMGGDEPIPVLIVPEPDWLRVKAVLDAARMLSENQPPPTDITIVSLHDQAELAVILAVMAL